MARIALVHNTLRCLFCILVAFTKAMAPFGCVGKQKAGSSSMLWSAKICNVAAGLKMEMSYTHIG